MGDFIKGKHRPRSKDTRDRLLKRENFRIRAENAKCLKIGQLETLH